MFAHKFDTLVMLDIYFNLNDYCFLKNNKANR